MAGNKRAKNSGSEMKNNPFKALKGFSVSDAKAVTAPEPTQPPAPKASAPEEPKSFAEEMAFLGVRPMVGRPDTGEPIVEKGAVPELLPQVPVSDEELFAEALGKLDTVFSDQFPEEDDEVSVAGSPRRMKQLRQGKLTPEATLDLHGMKRDEALNRVRYFLENSVYHGMKTVLIVTGRGKGSEGEPVLRSEVERYLADEGKTWLAEWGRAPKQHGGEGALAVFLKNAAQRRERP